MNKALSTLTAAAFLAVLTLTPADAHSQVAVGGHGNWGSESELGLGARVLANIPNVNLEAVGSVDFFSPGEVDHLDLNGNVFYHFHLDDTRAVVPYLGGGLNISRLSADDFTTTETGLNLGGGVRFPMAGLTPFVEARAVISDADQFVISGGLLFGPTRF